jgi:hypothetical protein
LQKRLEFKRTLESIKRIGHYNKEEIDKINSIWDTIEEAIITAASKHIPKKKIYNTASNRRSSLREQRQEENIVKLQRLLKYAKTKEGEKVTEEEKSDINEMVKR